MRDVACARAGVAWGEEADRRAQTPYGQVELGRQAAARASDRLSLRRGRRPHCSWDVASFRPATQAWVLNCWNDGAQGRI